LDSTPSLVINCREARGIEYWVATQAINLAKKTDLQVVNVDNEDLLWANELFDGCMAIEVLEHLFDPVHAPA